jgi:HlyD family secretion protein
MKIEKILVLLPLIIGLSSCGENGSNLYIEATGTIESTNVTISSKSVGEIKSIFAEEGALVSAGDTLLIIDSEALGYQLSMAEASEQIAEAQLSLMLKGARAEDIKQAEEMTKQSETNLSLAKNDYSRYTKLWESKAITQKQYEDITARFQIALAQFTAAKENYEKVKKIFRPEEIEQAKANLKKAKASVELLNKNIRDSYVISPINGSVVKKFIEVGETVSPMSSLVKISNLAIVNLTIYISESELGKIKLGQKTEISIDTYTDRIYEGKITFISPEAEFTPKNIQTKDERTKLVFAVKIEIPNPNFELKPGMPADAKVIL